MPPRRASMLISDPSVVDRMSSCGPVAVLRDGRRKPLFRTSTRHGNPVRTLNRDAAAVCPER
jgi:hypothetical protein